MIGIRIEGLEGLIKKIDSISGMRRVKAAIKASGHDMSRYMKRSYPRAQHRPNPMLKGNSAKAQRMRAGFFARLHAGEIEVPYRRGSSPGSKDLQNSWNVRTDNQGFRAIVGTGVSYARLVQDKAKQATYHKITGWPTTEDIVKEHKNEIIEKIQQALRNEVNQ